jgi:hypothetical protein
VQLEEVKNSHVAVAAPPQINPAASPNNDAAELVWAATKDTTSFAILADFIRQFGNTPYESMARARLEELVRSKVATQSKYPEKATSQLIPAPRNTSRDPCSDW